MNQKIIEIAHQAAKIPGLKQILIPVYYPLKKAIQERHKKRFQKNALGALEEFDKVMVTNGFGYTLIFGSLLGAIREKGFIKHDIDIDVAVPIEERGKEFYKVLSNSGFNIIRRYTIEDGQQGCEETFLFKNTEVTIDVFYIHPPIDKLPYCCCWNLYGDCATAHESMKKYGGVIPRRIELPFSYQFKRIPFESIQVNIDTNAQQISEYSYGPNYMTPDPDYVVPSEHRVVWSAKKAIYVEF